MMNTRPTDIDFSKDYQYYRLGIRWAKVVSGFHLYLWRPDTDRWEYVGDFRRPVGSGWIPYTEADCLRERLSAEADRTTLLRKQLSDIKSANDRLRAKNSALRREKWVAAGSKRRERKVKPSVRRFYHRDDGFADGVLFIEFRDGQVHRTKAMGGIVSNDLLSYEDGAKRFVPEGLWIEVRGSNIPRNLPKPPPVPEGYTHWEYHTSEWRTAGRTEFVWFPNAGAWVRAHAGYPMGLHDHYLEAKGPKDMSPQEALSGGPWKWLNIASGPTPKVRIFRSVHGFGDGTDRIEYADNEATIVTIDGTRHHSPWFSGSLDKAEEAVRQGAWYEVFDDSTQHRKVHLQQYADVVARTHYREVETTVRAALVAKFGHVPSVEVLSRHLHKVIDVNRVEHWLWLDEPLKIGDKAPLDKAICRISPVSYIKNHES